jgi:hypothetical protein
MTYDYIALLRGEAGESEIRAVSKQGYVVTLRRRTGEATRMDEDKQRYNDILPFWKRGTVHFLIRQANGQNQPPHKTEVQTSSFCSI